MHLERRLVTLVFSPRQQKYKLDKTTKIQAHACTNKNGIANDKIYSFHVPQLHFAFGEDTTCRLQSKLHRMGERTQFSSPVSLGRTTMGRYVAAVLFHARRTPLFWCEDPRRELNVEHGRNFNYTMVHLERAGTTLQGRTSIVDLGPLYVLQPLPSSTFLTLRSTSR